MDAAQLPEGRPSDPPAYLRLDGRVTRTTWGAGPGGPVIADLPDSADPALDAHSAFGQSWLRGRRRPVVPAPTGRSLTLVDLFSGVGGLSLGVENAAWMLGRTTRSLLAADMDLNVLNVYQRNLNPKLSVSDPIETLIDGDLGVALTEAERYLSERLGRVDFLVAGPPCQGHSNLNNHTRRNDPRNLLYERVARAAEVLNPEHIIIENVPGVVHDQRNVVERTKASLLKIGYSVDAGLIKAELTGVAQRRRRYFVVASRTKTPSIQDAIAFGLTPCRPITWAVGDLTDQEDGGPFDSSSGAAAVTKERMKYLFDNDLYDLPDSMRPACHRDKPHSYKSVYGRMYRDLPAPTITSGFGTMGQGRFVHPLEPRTLTPHEAARVQGLPDWFHFGGLSRTQLHKAIGNAVPPQMTSALAEHLLTLT